MSFDGGGGGGGSSKRNGKEILRMKPRRHI